MFARRCVLLLIGITAASAQAKEVAFSTGPTIGDFGPNIPVAGISLAPDTRFKVAFDIADTDNDGPHNRHMESLARFINMHARAGVKPANIQLAMVVHGQAGVDLLNDAAYKTRFGKPNPSTALLNALVKAGVSITLCGQSAAHFHINAKDLHQGASMALSAMTAHAQLQQQGYTLNPF